MTLGGKRGIDSAAQLTHFCPHMNRYAAYYFFGFAGYFAPRTQGGCPDA